MEKTNRKIESDQSSIKCLLIIIFYHINEPALKRQWIVKMVSVFGILVYFFGLDRQLLQFFFASPPENFDVDVDIADDILKLVDKLPQRSFKFFRPFSHLRGDSFQWNFFHLLIDEPDLLGNLIKLDKIVVSSACNVKSFDLLILEEKGLRVVSKHPIFLLLINFLCRQNDWRLGNHNFTAIFLSFSI